MLEEGRARAEKMGIRGDALLNCTHFYLPFDSYFLACSTVMN
jgi:hypothetical protein